MKLPLLFIACFSLFSSSAQLLIKNTTVADVEAKKLLAGQDVLIENGVITAVGKKIKIPVGITEIDGNGKFLIPGLVDAHIHFFQSGGLYTRPDAIDLRKEKPYENEIAWVHQNMEGFLRRYTKAGITTVIDVGSNEHFLQQRDSFKSKSYAPAIYITGPLLTTYEPGVFKGLKNEEPFYLMQSPDDARRLVQQQLPFKPDFIKIWYIVLGNNKDSSARASLPLVQAAIDEAHKNNLRVAVHATEQITATLAVQSGADYLVHGVEDVPVSNEFVQLLKTKGTVLSPTLVVADNYNKAFGLLYQPTDEDLKFAHPTPLNSLYNFQAMKDTSLMRSYKAYTLRNRSIAKTEDELRRANLKKLYEGGVTIATGTDAGNIGTQHVSSYFDELREMEKSGLSNWDLLQSSTINGAKAVGKEKEFGAIKKGMRADLLLLSKNPVDDISNWQSIDWVINKGVPVRPDSVMNYSPVELADQQLVAYNAHNLEAFLAPYSDDIEIYELESGKLQTKGKEAMRKQYSFLNNIKTLYCNLVNRIVLGNIIVDHEEIWTEGGSKFYGLAIYEIEGNKILKVWFPK